MSELIEMLRKEASRNARMQGDKKHQTNRRRKTFRGRNHLFTKAADRIEELETELSDQCADMKILWDALPEPHTEISVHVAAAMYIAGLEAREQP